MSQSKFSLADVLTVLAALGFGFVCFLSANFYTLGDTKYSVIAASVVAVLLGGLAMCVKLLKRTGGNFKICYIWEMSLLGLFVALALVCLFTVFPHYFSVIAKNSAFQTEIMKNITQAKTMFAEYEKYAKHREHLYRTKLQSVAAARDANPGEYAEYDFTVDVAAAKQIENKMFTVHADLFPSNYIEMKQVDSIWLAKSQKITESLIFNPIGIVGVVNKIEENTKEWTANLKELSTKRAKNEEAEDFSFTLSFGDIKQYFTTLERPPLLSVALALAAYAMMLLSWFVTKRSTKSTIGAEKRKGEFDINL